ncbi:glucose-1-phosphate adenylyltransferase [Dermatophilus congolensis]|uniref:glucose-1-phosphate adenylyltransferase n=1 Tax=Dermatophilus congolensis TaxID=1863 RepID=UPI001AAE4EC2|nr:glucose-1-phosphate adenylyltransferase [Dermatophilus congolensis]MBO3142874.1 glucose-1-phosphate adenylyltransferase [Dermatophilus congolensis]MBO3151865.1 glucose-1-phosphate adenylyltransferase [Dermatophilus congolensis]MBO3161130.1 glucose-1-phosphate adenylyltransferase [Dermatophilus congolensis]MBO3163148.1 glucose-1-phosphate adenylyltransferase [Dermatophilus congolensis]MBO3176703.1 glucose-1-phosphate adenylyltransferase [Dermatophilus congolensis]
MPTTKKRNPNVLAIVLAGGEGKRLMPLTADRAKPAVPFGGVYRLIDFALSNVVNSGYLKVVVLTQYKSHSLDRHISRTWRMSNMLGNYVAPIPAQQRKGKQWYMGSADAIYQSLNTLDDERPDIVVVVGADHVYRMDFSQMVEQHVETGAGITVAAIRQPIALADQFGVIEVDEADNCKIGAWREKPTDAKGLPDSPEEVLASMGNYVFDADVLRDVIMQDAENEDSDHDMGGDIVPHFVDRGEGFVYDFNNNEIPGATDRDRAYWRDVGTIDSYYEANMDLIQIEPIFNLYNYDWPLFTSMSVPYPPAKFVHNEEGRRGEALNSVTSHGTIISGGKVNGSVISPNVLVNSYSEVDHSVLLDNVKVGRKATIRRAILDKNVVVEPGATVGVDPEVDRAAGWHVSDGGVVVVPKGAVVRAQE